MQDDNRPKLRRDLIEYCNRIPPKVNDGSYNLSVQFKTDCVKYRRLASKPGVTELELHAAINRMHSYW